MTKETIKKLHLVDDEKVLELGHDNAYISESASVSPTIVSFKKKLCALCVKNIINN